MLNRNKRKQEEDRLFACGTETKAANKRPLVRRVPFLPTFMKSNYFIRKRLNKKDS